MAIVIDQTYAATTFGSGTTASTGFQTPALHAAIFIGVNSAQPVSSFTDSIGNTYQLFSAPADGSNEILTMGYCPSSIASSSSHITAHFGTASICTLAGLSFTGLAQVTPFDCSVNTQSNPSGGSIPSGSLPTTRFTNELLLSLACEGGASGFTFTKDAAFTLPSGMAYSLGTASGRSICFSYRIVSSTGVYSSTVTSTNSVSNANHLLAAFADTDVPTGSVDPGVVTRKAGRGFLTPQRGFGRMVRSFLPQGGLLVPHYSFAE